MEKIYKTLSAYKKRLEKKGYEVLYIGLFGSQNYNLHDKSSDIDAKAIVAPSLRDIVRRKVVSKVYQFDEGEVDVKDVVTFNDVIRKGNPAYIEVVHTNYFIGDKELRELLGFYIINPMAVYGMAREKLAAIEKGLPASSPMIEKIGYDPKQLHHIYRLYDLVAHANNTDSKDLPPFIRYEDGDERDYLLDVKRHGIRAIQRPTQVHSAIDYAKIVLGNLREDIAALDFRQADIEEKILAYVERKLAQTVFKGGVDGITCHQVRTFGGNVPRRDRELFDQLKDRDGEDFSYVIYSYLEEL